MVDGYVINKSKIKENYDNFLKSIEDIKFNFTNIGINDKLLYFLLLAND